MTNVPWVGRHQRLSVTCVPAFRRRMADLAERWVRSFLVKVASEEVLYAGVFLPSMSKQRLLRAFPPVHPTVWAHHMTIWHFQDGGDMPDLPWGKTVDLKVVGHFSNDSAQAVVVDPPSRLRPQGRTPHITISTEAGVAPATSNALVPGPEELEPVRGLPAIKGVVGWVDSREQVHFEPPPSEV